MGEDKDSHKCNQRPDQDHYCEPFHRLCSKKLRKFPHLLSCFLDFWTLGSSALGEGSSKDTRSGFTPHGTENPPQIASVTRNTLTTTEERPTLEDITNRVGKSPEAVQDGFDLELQNHWFRLHLEKKETKIQTFSRLSAS